MAVAEDVGDIYSTLFDQKPVLKREIEYFIQEFEEKRKEKEIENLFRILEHMTELKQTEIPRTQSLGDIHLPKLISDLQVAESISDKLLRKLDNSEQKYNEKLERHRAHRSAEWETFVHDMTTKCIRIDNLYRDKQNEVRVQYQRAEENLLIKSNLSPTNPNPK